MAYRISGRPRRRAFRHSRAVAVGLTAALLAAGCGARLTKAQMDALNGTGSSAAGTGTAIGAGSSGTGQAVSAGTGSDSSGGPAPAPAAGSSGGAGSAPGGAVAASGPATTQPATATGGSNSGGATQSPVTVAGGSKTVSEASNPLAGPGGKVCAPGAPGSGPGVTASTVTIGNIATINGPVPGLFAGARYGTEAVAAYINSMGGLCGRKVVVNSADDQFDQATDQNEASSMASNVLAFVGSFSLQDGGIPAGAPDVPDIGGSLSSARFSSPMNFSPQPQPPGYITGPFIYLKSQPQYADATQHMALLVENTPQTAAQGKYLQDALNSVGYHFVFTDTTLQPTDPTFNGDVQKMKAAGVTGVVFEATGTILGQLANAMYQAGMKIVLGNYCAAAYDPAYIKNAGPGTAGTILEQSLALYDGEDAAAIPMVATLDQWYNRVNPGQVPDLYAVYGWMSGLLFAQAVNESGALTRPALKSGLDSITSFTGDGLAAPVNPVSKTPASCYVLITVQNGKFVRDASTPSGFRCSPSGYHRE